MPFALVSNGSLLTPEQPDVTVPWWSFTKTVLAAAALSLVRDGLIGLDEGVPEGPFTLRQLLRHEAGLADYSELADYHTAVARHETPWSAAEMLQRLDATRLRYAPGDGWRYSNVGYLFIARLIVRVTGLRLEEALTQRVFAPLGLSRIRLATTRADLAYVNMGAASTYDPGWVYHGLLVGPLVEAALCLDRLLDGHLLPQSLLREMQTVRTLGGPIAGRPWVAPGYGLGLMQGMVESGLTLSGHTGVGPGSIIAVYRCIDGNSTASCAVFDESGNEGAVEAEVVRHLICAALE
ncbi:MULTISPECIES: serine hydrolase [unclassified Pseudomonas]|uniref:serine hydrolase domain-containing protein n=1 Tax=unclassified Pseudomonas TaxID=196821 RepID=UPI000C868B28|nr:MULTISPECIES: serine hydrolase domain-containing protein [unclassified Pseudomonas]PMV86259.1 serine hydrolase [Pseudomonas sp. GW101-1A09]PMV90159.1 serine hydrolase [Pseudomonas sp. GW460-C8]PMV91147.1 serine hydrolase [Pseudomonas sp. FW306-2-2C-B10A]PMW04687.1 serine hydrolase [Pseudomonas sp. MPR-TSA4]PMW08532.1 serine hydrolase [Pseudomonas sp. FW306-2-1A-C05A]